MIIIIKIKVMIKIKFYSLKFCRTSFLYLRVNEVVVFKIFKLLLNLFKIDGPLSEWLLLYILP